MLVSHFEMMVKRITPTGGIPPNVSAPFRRVIQGYFLTITNLGSSAKNFKLRFKITNNTPNRSITPLNTQWIFDNTTNVFLTIPPTPVIIPLGTQRWETPFFNIGANQTAIFAMVPNLNIFLNNPNPDLEIRGYVELLQQTSFLPWPIAPVPVLLTPETRGTFLDNEYPNQPPTSELDFDQIAYSLPLSSGKAENLVEGISFPDLTNLFDLDGIKGKVKMENPQLENDEIDTVSKTILKMIKSVQK